jgi:hypothetical protein
MKKTGTQKSTDTLKESPALSLEDEHKLLQELRDLQMEAINSFRAINEKVKFSALNVFLLQGLTQSKALWEEINQLLLMHLGEAHVLNTINGNANGKNKYLTDIEKQDMIGLIRNIKLFEEYTISIYQRAMNKPLSTRAHEILQLQLEALHTRYHRLTVLEKKVASE